MNQTNTEYKKITIKLKPHNTLKAISLFSGAGGDTLGLERARYKVVAYSEHIPKFIQTHKQMFPHSVLLSHNGSTNIRDIPDKILEQYYNNIDLIFAGFPCQGFSHAGKKQANDPRNELVYEFIRVTKCIRPTWIIGENVSGLLSRNGLHPITNEKLPVIKIINCLFNEIGYSLTWKIINANDFGVPQNRQRLIIIGHDNTKINDDNYFPHIEWDKCMTHIKTALRPLIEDTLEGAIDFPKDKIQENTDTKFWFHTNLESPPKDNIIHPNLIRLMAGIRNKSKLELINDTQSNDKTIINPNGLISFGRRISPYHGEIVDLNKQCKTIICTYATCPRLFVGLHNPDKDKYWIRTFTLNELAQIQAFPNNYNFCGNTKDIITQIGNAVPPPIVTNIVNNINNITFKPYQQI